MTCGACGTPPESKGAPKGEILEFVTRHPIATFFLGLAAVGWTLAVTGAIVSPCDKQNKGV
jgi:hypothetical protein